MYNSEVVDPIIYKMWLKNYNKTKNKIYKIEIINKNQKERYDFFKSKEPYTLFKAIHFCSGNQNINSPHLFPVMDFETIMKYSGKAHNTISEQLSPLIKNQVIIVLKKGRNKCFKVNRERFLEVIGVNEVIYNLSDPLPNEHFFVYSSENFGQLKTLYSNYFKSHKKEVEGDIK